MYLRLRRNRKVEWLREILAETSLKASDLILPIFIVEGKNQIQPIKTMPNIFRYSIDRLLLVVKEASESGIKAIALFPNIDERLKSSDANEACNKNNLICRAIKLIKDLGIDIGIICDVALDPYTLSGHDGIVVDNDVDNDQTLKILSEQALILADAGADIVAPSDMMDGRVLAIRNALDKNGFNKVNILSYSAKYNSSFYGPFRDAIGSVKKKYLSKATYQMNITNSREAMREIEEDIKEGADMIMIKPAMPFLDIIKEASKRFDSNIFAYQVSGEYAMIKHASQIGIFDYSKAMLESLICIKRSGATGIFTYGAIDIAKLINKRI